MTLPLKSSMKVIAIAFVSTIFFFSCDTKKELPQYEHIVSIEQIKSYSSEQIKVFLALARIKYHEIDSIIPPAGKSVKIYKLSYRTSFNGELVTASGLVCVPDSIATYPVISFHNGTNTCHQNTPTENPTGQLYSMISMMAAHGYIISIPDYLGFGDSDVMLHPYMHRESIEQAVSDMLLAVNEFIHSEEVEASTNGDLYLMGYSQGGWATLSMLDKLEKMPLDGFKPKAAACGAGAYDLSFMGSYIIAQEAYPTTFYMPYFIESRIENGLMSNDLLTFFKEPYATSIPSWFDGSYCNAEINEQFPEEVNLLMQGKFITDYTASATFDALRNELGHNSVDPWAMGVPVRFYHSKGDRSVPAAQSQIMFDSLLALGVPPSQISLVYHPVDTLDHNDVIVPWGVDALTWINSLSTVGEMMTEKTAE